MHSELQNFMSANRPLIEDALAEHLPLSRQPGAERINRALGEAVFPGGKRFRPLLTVLGARVVGGDVIAAMPAACAVEFLHTSSIILDDLPAMDDADLRRGRPALHLAYGEGVALLAALALLNQAYALLSRCGRQPEVGARLLREATACVGVDGMIGGQAADLDGDLCGGAAVASRDLKTTALMQLTMTAGAIACGADDEDAAALACYGKALGTAYQIRDDLLDEFGDAGLLGKTVGQDERHRRASFVRELGGTGARTLACTLVNQGRAVVERRFGITCETRLLADVAAMIVHEIEGFGLAARTTGD